LLHLYGVKPGRNAVVVTDRPGGYRLAADLLQGGVSVNCVIDIRRDRSAQPPSELSDVLSGVAIHSSHTILEAIGNRQVEAVRIAESGQDGSVVSGTERELTCDLVCVSAGGIPRSELLYQTGSKLRYDPATGEFLPVQLASGVYVAGEVAGTCEPE